MVLTKYILQQFFAKNILGLYLLCQRGLIPLSTYVHQLNSVG